MKRLHYAGKTLLAISASLILLAPSCATKKHVLAQIEPIGRRVGDLETKSKKTDASIGELERGVSQADERARGADGRAIAAMERAGQAFQKAESSGQQAELAQTAATGAKTLAEQGLTKTAELDKDVRDVNRRVASFDKYRTVGAHTVLFAFGKSVLTDDGKKALDEVASATRKLERYVLEIQGFTDSIGSADYNLQLSEKRASEVVRYLTGEHKVPLYRIFLLGNGSAQPAGDPKTSEGRKLSRRVEVRVYTNAEPASTTRAGSGAE